MATLCVNGVFKDLRTIRELIKNGTTIESFATMFNCSPQDFMDALENKTGSKKFSEYEKDLKRNEKKPKREKAITLETSNQEEEKIVMSEKMVDQYEEELLAREANIRSDIESYNSYVANLQQKKNLAKKNQSYLRTQTDECKKELIRLHEKMEDLKVQYASCCSEIDEYEKQIEEYDEKISMAGVELEEVVEKLELCRAIEIYSDQEGFHVSNSEYIPDKITVNEELCKLADESKLKEFTFDIVKRVAEIKAAIALIEIVGAKYVINDKKCSENVIKAFAIVESAAS